MEKCTDISDKLKLILKNEAKNKMKELIFPLILASLVACQLVGETNKDGTKIEENPKLLVEDSKKNEAEVISPEVEEVIIPEKIEKQVLGSDLPKSVRAFIQSHRKDCGQEDDVAEYKRWVTQADIVADQKNEFILEPAQFMCDDANMMYGRGGTEIFVFGQNGQGDVKQLFSHVIFGYELTAKVADKPQQLWLDLGGGFCGQDMDQISIAEAITCKRLVGLNFKSKTIELTDIKLDK